MSILIPGMEMPTSCYKCYLKQRNGMDVSCPVTHERFSVADINILEYRLDSCPLIHVPEHGRLIDWDVMCNECRRTAEEYDGIYPDCTYCPAHLAPTIIPAEESET